MPITAFYAALFGAMLILLSVRVIGVRRQKRVALGHGGDKALEARIRAHANFTEYVPISLILIGAAESLGALALLLHGLGLALLGGRILHALAVSGEVQNLNLRVAGMATTFTAIGVGAATCLLLSLPRLAGG
jgi:hypothetical protein